MFRTIIFLFFPLLSISGFAHATSIEIDTPPLKSPLLDNLIGYEYNLWAVKAENKTGSSEYEFTGRLFLDKRKDYKASYEEDEHFFFFKEKFSNGEIFKIPGSHETTKYVNKNDADNYYVALKFGPQWKHHQLRDILENVDTSVGSDVGCNNCNYKKSFYDYEKDWALTVYYEIKPIFKKSDKSDSDMARIVLASLEAKEGFGDAISSEDIAVHESPLNEEKSDVVKQTTIQKEVTSKSTSVINTHEVITATTSAVEKAPPVRIVAPITEIVKQDVETYHVLFRVLNDPNQTFEDLKHLGPLYKETFDANGSTRYLIGNTRSMDEAIILEQMVNELGYNSTILASYKDGKLGKYIDSPAVLNNVPPASSNNNSARGFGKPIQFTAIGKSNKTFSELSHLGEVFSEKVSGKNLYRYKLRPYGDLDIGSVVTELKQLGFTGAFVSK